MLMPIVSRLFILLLPKQIRYRYGLYDEVSISTGFRVRHCNWIRFLRVSDTYGPQVSARIFFCCFGWMLIGDRACANLLVHLSAQVNIVCTKVKGEPLYEVVKPLAAHQELVVFYLPEGPARPEELFFVHMRSTLYRRTMDSILEGECATPSLVCLRVWPQLCANYEHQSRAFRPQRWHRLIAPNRFGPKSRHKRSGAAQRVHTSPLCDKSL